MKNKIIDGFYKLKSYWRTSPSGYDVSYKEVSTFTIGFGSLGILSVLLYWTTLGTNIPLLTGYFKASSGIIFIMVMLSSIVGLVRAPILSILLDNSNSRHGKFRPFIIPTCAISCVCFGLLPFIPASWVNTVAFSFRMPAIPIFGVLEASQVSVSVGIVVFFVLLQIGTTVHQLFLQSMTGIENTISSITQERTGIIATKNLISNLPNSLVNVLIPAVAGILFVAMGTNKTVSVPMENVVVYRIFFPIVAVIALFLSVVMFKGVKERVVVGKKHTNKVSFWTGAKELSKNKYFWMLVFFTIFSSIRGQANIFIWICNYSIPGETGSTIMAICNIVLNNAFIPGLLLGPLLVKKFGKAKVMNFSNIGFAIMCAMQLLFLYNPYLTLVGIFFQNLCMSVSFVSSLMTSDVLDYQQYKTNKRLEGFWHNYTAFILTFVTIFTSILNPLMLSMAGINFDANLSVAMQNPLLRDAAYRNVTLLALVGGILTIIPMLFYDMSEYKHKNIIRGLKIRKAIENYRDNALEDSDVLGLKEVIDYITEIRSLDKSTDLTKKQQKNLKSSYLVFDELAKCTQTEIDTILKGYPLALARHAHFVEQDELGNLKRNLEFEEKLIGFKITSAKKKAIAKKTTFDEVAFEQSLIEKSRFIKMKESLSKLGAPAPTSLDEIAELISTQEVAELAQALATASPNEAIISIGISTPKDDDTSN